MWGCGFGGFSVYKGLGGGGGAGVGGGDGFRLQGISAVRPDGGFCEDQEESSPLPCMPSKERVL